MTHAAIRAHVLKLQRLAGVPGRDAKKVRKQARKRLQAFVAKLQGR